MSYKSRDRESRLRSFRHSYGEGEYQFGDWNVEPIHQILQPIEVGNEFDYWAINKSDCFLITFGEYRDTRGIRRIRGIQGHHTN